MAAQGTAQRTVEWATHNRGAGARKITRWDRLAGFPTGTQWCGIFLGAAMRSQGITPPSGYAAAVNWSNFGTSVEPGHEQPGDILVYGSNHVAMYVGEGHQIQGNDQNGTVGTSGIGSGLGLGPITAIRRPPYKGAQSESSSEPGFLERTGDWFTQIINPGQGASEAPKKALSVADEVVQGVVGDLAKSAEPLMLNIALLGGGAFLIYYGVALMAGVDDPGLKLLRTAKRGGEAGAAAAVVK